MSTLDQKLAPTVLAAAPRTTPERAARARRALVAAAALGILADMLLRDGPVGIGLVLWMLLLAASIVALTWHRAELSREQAWWIAAAVLFSGGLAWRDSEVLQFFDFAATLAILCLLSFVLAGAPQTSVLTARVRDLVLGAVHAATSAFGGVVRLVFKDADLRGAVSRPAVGGPQALKTALRALIITIPLVLIFGALFREADPVFASIVRIPAFDLGPIISHVVVAGFFAWIVAGWMRGALVSPENRPNASGTLPTIGVVELTTMLGALNVLFGSFVIVQIGWLYGGQDLVQRTTGLSVAQYARRGFFELVWVSMLTLPVLLGVHAVLPAEDRRMTRRFRALAAPLLVLLGAVMISALVRMQLYVRFFGLSVDRLNATAIMTWLAIVFVWFALTVLRGWARPFAAGMVISGMGVLATLNAVSPDALVARVNISRARERGAAAADSLDRWYLARTSGDAVPVLVPLLLAPPMSKPGTATRVAELSDRCRAVDQLLDRWAYDPVDEQGKIRERSWTSWNYGASRARRIVRANETALRATTCPTLAGAEEVYGQRRHWESPEQARAKQQADSVRQSR